jgi:murein DD-endopeptidase MepM/ murein hydrolase activator NlpD
MGVLSVFSRILEIPRGWRQLLRDLESNSMKESSLPISTEGEHCTAVASPSRSHPIFLRFAIWCLTTTWRACVDWRTKRPLLTRATAHLSIIALALITIVLSGVGIPTPRAAVGGPSDADVGASSKVASSTGPESSLPLTPPLPTNQYHPPDTDTVARLPVPHTTFPQRPRAQVITYAVQKGDNISTIAARFGLDVYTVIWSNREVLKDAPWLVQPGLELFILPVDGIYHTVRSGETVASIAVEYELESAALYNEWNDLEEGEQPREGQLLVVPGGQSERVDLEPPRPKYAVSGASQWSWGVCSGVTFTGPGANGWFILPTGSSRVSGWYFHDWRNPTHIGLDYACRLGDPIYASDNGVVTIAGWNGGYGVLVELNHGNGFATRYGHFNDIAVGCGQAVYQGDLLGYCGSTGWSSGPHLHFEIRYNGVPQDPQAYLP